MFRIIPFLLLITLSPFAYAQVEAVVVDSILDKYYINYPVEKGPEVNVGDTVAAIYNTEPTFWDNQFVWIFKTTPVTKAKPVYVVRAIVTAVDSTIPMHIMGVRLKIYAIEKHFNDNITYLQEYKRPHSDCVVKVGKELWCDTYDWQNTSRLYRIAKFTDNYKVGDTVGRHYFTPISLIGHLFGTGRTKHYHITAVVRGIDTTAAQRLLLEFLFIELSYSKHNFFLNKHTDVTEYPAQMEYEYVTVRKGEPVWAKPYHWLKKWQFLQIMGDAEVPYSAGVMRGCGFRIILYDCDGNLFQ